MGTHARTDAYTHPLVVEEALHGHVGKGADDAVPQHVVDVPVGDVAALLRNVVWDPLLDGAAPYRRADQANSGRRLARGSELVRDGLREVPAGRAESAPGVAVG